jgi:peptidoglycan/LPS O-acetylase OafA/YrhL
MPRLGYVAALDGIRGLAILGVVLSHAERGGAFGHYVPFLFRGTLGVDLFFVLSGFLITTLLIEERAASGRLSLRGFYARRARRLLPALGVMLLAYVFVDGGTTHALHRAAMYGLYFGNLYQAVWAGSGYTGLNHLWSLAEEEQFYLFWPLAMILISRSAKPLRWTAGLFVAALGWRTLVVTGAVHSYSSLVNLCPDTNAGGLMLGAVLAYWRPRVGNLVALGSLAGVLGLWFVGLPTWADSPLFDFASAGLVLAAVSPTVVARGLSTRSLVWLGTISYSLYLWHFWILATLGWPLRAVTIPVSVLVAWLSYRYVEVPFRRRREQRPVLEPAAAGR